VVIICGLDISASRVTGVDIMTAVVLALRWSPTWLTDLDNPDHIFTMAMIVSVTVNIITSVSVINDSGLSLIKI
jgi:hypothetical protein